MKYLPCFAFALLFSIACPHRADAHGGGGDIALFNTGGQTDIGFAELDDDDINQLSFDPNDSVFQAVLTPVNRVPVVFPYDFGSSEPGYDANERESLLPGQFSSGLPSDALVTWQTVGLDYWDGQGELAFTPATGVEAGYAGPSTGETDSAGGFHLHPTFGLGRTDEGPLAEGVYLATLTVTVGGLAESDEFYLVTLIDEVINEATTDELAQTMAEDLGATVREYLAGDIAAPMFEGKDFTFYGDAIRFAESLAIPEPTSALLIATCLGALVRRR